MLSFALKGKSIWVSDKKLTCKFVSKINLLVIIKQVNKMIREIRIAVNKDVRIPMISVVAKP
jgi:hypothetical protein